MKNKYSFTQAKPKHIFKLLTKIWGFYCMLMFAILLGFKIFISMQIHELKETQVSSNDSQADLRAKISKMTLEEQRIQAELKIITLLKKNDDSLQTQVNNIINMIPDQITLNSIVIENDKLYMSGTTPSKEIFINSLQLPFKSIFDKSEVSFNGLSNGMYNFKSISKIESSKDLESRVKTDITPKVVNEDSR